MKRGNEWGCEGEVSLCLDGVIEVGRGGKIGRAAVRLLQRNRLEVGEGGDGFWCRRAVCAEELGSAGAWRTRVLVT
jgi:hypothetical protein